MKWLSFLLFPLAFACSKKSETTTTPPTTTAVPDVYKKIYGASEMYVQGDYVIIKSTALPDHKSPYYQGTQWANTKYEAYNGNNPNYMTNPNRIAQFTLTFKIPLNPKAAANPTATALGPMGVSLNGVPLYNQYAAGNAPLTNEINSFDQYNGHPQQQGQYHYHIEPLYLTAQKGKSSLMGFYWMASRYTDHRKTEQQLLAVISMLTMGILVSPQIILTASIIITSQPMHLTLTEMGIMVRRALCLSSWLLMLLALSCRQNTMEAEIPAVFTKASDPSLKQEGGFLYQNNQKYSGRTYELYANGDTALSFSYVNGLQQGWSYRWYEGRKLMEERFYEGGGKECVHRGWWPDGRQKFIYRFEGDEHHGEATEWFMNGKPSRSFHYAKGHEDGLQRMWWEDGSIRANYVVKDGQQYGLIGRKLCVNNDSTKIN